MSRFDEHPSDMTIAGLGDTSPFGRVTAGMLAGNKAQIGHNLLCRIKSGQITDFGNGRRSNNQGDTAQSLQSLHQRCQVPLWHQLLNLLSQPLGAIELLLNCMNIFLEHDLLSSMWHLDIGDPVPVCLGPIRQTTIPVTMTKNKGQ